MWKVILAALVIVMLAGFATVAFHGCSVDSAAVIEALPATPTVEAKPPTRANQRASADEKSAELQKVREDLEAQKAVHQRLLADTKAMQAELAGLKASVLADLPLPQSAGREALSKATVATARFPDGGCLDVGATDGDVDLGAGRKLLSEGKRKVFAVRFDKDGVPQWEVAATNDSGGDQRTMAAATYPDGSSVIGGFFNSGVATFKDATGAAQIRGSNGGCDAFVAKLSADGRLLWLTTFGGPGQDDGVYGLAILSDGGCYAIGRFGEAVLFGSQELKATNNQAGFVSRLDSSGNFVWTRVVTCKNPGVNTNPKGVCTLPDNSCIVVGTFYDQAGFNTGQANEIDLRGAGKDDFFVARYWHADGAVSWAKSGGGTGGDNATSVTLLQGDEVCSVVVTIDGAGNLWSGEAAPKRLDNLKPGLSVYRVAVSTVDGSLVGEPKKVH